MEQQEFVPKSQPEKQQQMDEEELEIPAQPYYWSTRPNTPKDEPSSLYDVPMAQSDTQGDYQSGYMAQETMADASQRDEKIDASNKLVIVSQAPQAQQQRQQSGFDGDAHEYQYRPNYAGNQQQNFPPFARPRVRMRNPARLIWLIVLGLIFFTPLMQFLGALLAVVGVILAVLLLLFLLVLLVGILFLIFRFGRRWGRFNNGQRRWRYTNSWRGPWGW
jgi:hypothetical protein